MKVQLSDGTVGVQHVTESDRYVVSIMSSLTSIQVQVLLHPDQVLALSDLLREALRPQLPFS